ncbi:MAG: outer membrane lipoprotein-sorting protein, partial [Spirochaetes bacterium]|nr:outer membrane lipoprotein-sorting protein [Spirochaetota bacterium]
RNSGVAGSDFSYNDMSNTKYSKSYKCRLLSSSGSDYSLELKPKKNTDTGYSKLIVNVDKKSFITKKILYYNQDGGEFKRLLIKKVKIISGIITPMEFEMKNLITGNVTEVEIIKIKYLNRLRRIFFSSGGLSRTLETWKAVYPFFK